MYDSKRFFLCHKSIQDAFRRQKITGRVFLIQRCQVKYQLKASIRFERENHTKTRHFCSISERMW